MSTSYTDMRNGLVGDLAVKAPVRVATTAAITLSGLQTIDGIALASGDRVLVKDQASSVDNGIWNVGTGAWSRALDFDGEYDVVKGTMVLVAEGNTYAGQMWQLQTANPITIGTTGLTFARSVITEAQGEPLVIVAFGQSNFARSLSYAWTPPENLLVWNVAQDGTSLGTAFAAASGSTISTPVSLAAEFARANPGRQVYLINASASAMAIAQWLPTPTGTDMYAFLKTNVEAALTVLGMTKLPADTIFASWQGESDAGAPQNYIANRNTLLARLRAETWCPYAFPHIVFGISDYINSTFSAFNNYLVGYCSTNPGTHIYVHTATLPITYWDPADANPYIHCLAAGYWAAGVLGYQNFVGPHRALMQGWTVDPKTGNTSFGAGAANTTHRLYIEQNVNGLTSLYLRNGTAGTAAFAALYLGTDAGTLSVSAGSSLSGSNIFENWTGSGARTSRAPGFSFQRSSDGKEAFHIYSNGGIGLSSEGTNNYNIRLRNIENITTDRQLYLATGDADRTVEIGGNIALNKAKTPASNGDLVIEATNNTTVTIRYKGSDGTVRSGTITLS